MCNSCLLCWNALFCLLKQIFNVLHCPTLFFNVLECANFCLLQWLWMCWNVQLLCLLTDVYMCWHCNVKFFCLINDIFKGVIFCDSILIINPILDIDIQRWQRKKEGKTGKKKERKRAKNKIKSAYLWPLLIVIKLTYTRIGFVSLIYVLVCQGSVPLVQRTRFFVC